VFKNLSTMFFKNRFSDKTAKNRLQMILVQDRSGLSSSEMEYFRRDLIEVLERYFVLERKTLEIDWQRNDNCTALVINTPVVGRSPDEKVAVAS
jgi:cell division topological specificity factor MinE